MNGLPPCSPAVRARLRDIVAPMVVAAAGAVLVWLVGVRGADYPAHLLRAELWEKSGVSVWNFHWYGGHPTPTYSIIVPPLVASVGAFPVVAASSVAATGTFARLVNSRWSGRWAMVATMCFALSCIVNVLVGRVAFAVGLALALAAVLAWERGGLAIAIGLAVLVPLASPVASAFLGLAALTQLVATSPWRGWTRASTAALAVAGAATAPLGVIALAYQSEGRFPFRGGDAALSLVLIVVLAVLTRDRVIRIGAVLAAVVTVAVFVVPNPLGGNFLRLTQFVVTPLILVAFGASRWSHSRRFVALAIAAIAWIVWPGVATTVAWLGDDSVTADYHQPLVDEVRDRNRDGRPVGRLEIPFTENHWESYFVSSEVPFARGWERQLDLERNAVLYEDDLTVRAYLTWLQASAVRWIAIPDVDLDEGGSAEAALIRSGAVDSWLEHVWSNRDWVLYEVVDYQPIVDPPAVLVAERSDAIVVSTPRAATVIARYTVADGVTITPAGCVTAEEGWMRLALPAAGTYTIGVDVDSAIPGQDEASCVD